MNQAQKMSRAGQVRGGAPMDPESLTRKSFDTVFRGFDPEQVRDYLNAAADALRSARERVYALETTMSDLERRSRAAEAELKRREVEVEPEAPQVEEVPLPSLADLDTGELAKLVGDETARVIETARRAAAEIVERSQVEREETLADAEKLAAEVLAAAEAALEERRAQVDGDLAMELEAGRTRAKEVASAAAELVERAEAKAEELREEAVKEATAIGDRARLEALDLIDEAKALRRRLLEDLAHRRHQACGQLELLQAGHDRLLESFAAVRDAIEPAASLAGVMLTDAKAAAEQARRRVEVAGPVSVDELEELLDEIRRAGRRVSTVGTAEEKAVAEDETGDLGGEHSESDADESDQQMETVGEQAEPAAEVAEEMPIAPPPVEGRHSSSVRVFRRGELDGDDEDPDEAVEATDHIPGDHDLQADDEEVVTSLFARIRADREEMETYVRPDSVEREGAEADLGHDASGDEAGEGEPPAGEAADADSEPVTAELLERREAAMVGPRRGLGRALKRALADEQNEVLEAVSSAGTVPAFEEVYPQVGLQAAGYADAARSDLRDAAYAGAHLMGSPPDGAERPVVDDLASSLAEVLVEPLREQVRRCWDEAGDDEVELLELLRGTYRQWKNRVIDKASARVVVEAFNRGLTVAQGDRARAWLAPAPSSD